MFYKFILIIHKYIQLNHSLFSILCSSSVYFLPKVKFLVVLYYSLTLTFDKFIFSFSTYLLLTYKIYFLSFPYKNNPLIIKWSAIKLSVRFCNLIEPIICRTLPKTYAISHWAIWSIPSIIKACIFGLDSISLLYKDSRQ